VYTRGCLFVERSMRAGIDQGLTPHPRAQLAASMPVLSRELQLHSWYMVGDDDFAFGIENNLRGLRALLASDRKQARTRAAR
jgi:hypothetical protein